MDDVDAAKLDSLAWHVAYELQMLVYQALAVITGAPSGFDGLMTLAIKNALLESSLLHIRVLDEFFGGRESKQFQTDLRATMWVPDGSFFSRLGEPDRTRIDKGLAHLSELRADLDPNWKLGDLTDDCCATFETFLNELDPERLPAFAVPGCPPSGTIIKTWFDNRPASSKPQKS